MHSLSSLRICFLVGTLGQGGAERQLYYVLRQLKENGANIKVLCLTHDEFWEEPIRKLGIHLSWVGHSENWVVRLFEIAREVRKFRPHIIQSQHFYGNSYVGLVSRLLGCKGVGAIRNDGYSEINELGWFFGNLSLSLPHIIAANSVAGISYAKAAGYPENKFFLLPNAVDTQWFHPKDVDKHKDSVIRLLSVGRLVRQKRFDRLLSVLAQIRNQYSGDFRAIIAGDGPERKKLEDLAAGLDLTSDVVEFCGSVADLTPFYQGTDIFILCSDWEGTPNVLLEAMASEIPVVATNVGGISDIVHNGISGFLVEPNDERALVLAITQLMESLELRRSIGQKGREFIVNNHSLSHLFFNLEYFYEKVLNV